MDMSQSKKAANNRKAVNKIAALDKNSATFVVATRILIMVIAECLIGLGLKCFNDLFKTDPSRAARFALNAVPVLKWIFIALSVLAAVYLVITIVKKIDTSAYFVTPLMIFAVMMSMAATLVLFNRFTSATYLFWIAAGIVCVFFALYYIYTILMYKK